MTSTHSAANTGLPSNRRSFLGALAAVTIASGSALAASIPPPANDPDPVAALESELTAARGRLQELGLLCDEAYEAAEQIPIPSNLFCMSNDWIFVDPSGVLGMVLGPHGKAAEGSRSYDEQNSYGHNRQQDRQEHRHGIVRWFLDWFDAHELHSRSRAAPRANGELAISSTASRRHHPHTDHQRTNDDRRSKRGFRKPIVRALGHRRASVACACAAILL